MIGAAEIQRSLAAAWEILRGRADAMRLLDTSDEGFWRSFQAILLIAPIYLITSAADWQATLRALPEGAGIDGGAFWLSRALILIADWVTFPIILAALAGFIGIKQRYGAYIVARNWATVLAVAPFGLIAVLDLMGMLPAEIIIIPSLVAVGFALRVSYMVARTALGFTIDMAVGLVAFDFLISLGIVAIASQLFGV